MTEQRREEAIKYIESQLEDGYIDLGMHDKDELEIIKEAMCLLKAIDYSRYIKPNKSYWPTEEMKVYLNDVLLKNMGTQENVMDDTIKWLLGSK